MAKVKAYAVTNLVLNDFTESVKDKYLIQSYGAARNMKIPYNNDEFMNIYIDKEHRTSCHNAYNELKI